jgi:hypothetical protein
VTNKAKLVDDIQFSVDHRDGDQGADGVGCLGNDGIVD